MGASPSLVSRLPERIPVLFWGEGYEDGSKPFAERLDDGTVVFYADIIAGTFFMLSRWEESVNPVRDAHGRFPATASVAHREGFLDLPIVNIYGLILNEWIQTILPGWMPEPPKFRIKISHDIDSVWSGNGLLGRGRTVAGDLLKRRDPKKALLTAWSIFQPQSDPMFSSIFDLAKQSEECGLQAAFYFMAARKGQYDQGYDPARPLVRQTLQELHNRGHEIGFHPSYRAAEDLGLWREELARLRASAGDIPICGGRQHYLRFQTPQTWRLWEEAGLEYDSTLSYADHEGFRCGTCHPFRPYDVERDRVMDVTEIPLIVMDGTLKQYRNLTPGEAEQRILTLAERCKQVGGTFTMLWHNSSLIGEWASWAPMYKRVLQRLSEWVDG